MNIQNLLEGVSLKKLAQAVQTLSEAYRARVGFSIDSEEKALAYLLYRTPATMGVLRRVLEEIPDDIFSVCDCGAGAGTSLWPLHEMFTIDHVTLIEENKQLISIGQRIEKEYHDYVWKQGDVKQLGLQEHDLFLFSYSLNELKVQDAVLVLKKAFQKAKKYIVIIEPGTKEGYQRILDYREALIDLGGYIVAPCPHIQKCPLPEGDWCHFSQRIERTKEHRYLKGGSLGYEDEKYSYLIFSKKVCNPNGERILSMPRKEKHALFFKVCGVNGLDYREIAKSKKKSYNLVKKQHWGDIFPCGIIPFNEGGDS